MQIAIFAGRLLMQILAVLSLFSVLPASLGRSYPGRSNDSFLTHPWTHNGSSLVGLRHAAGLKLGHPEVEIPPPGAPWSDQAEQLVGGRNPPFDRDRAIRLALCGEAEQRHPETARRE